ncbi:hypothetical protein BDV06DRAFT_206628 [Aspergillus oleicola]
MRHLHAILRWTSGGSARRLKPKQRQYSQWPPQRRKSESLQRRSMYPVRHPPHGMAVKGPPKGMPPEEFASQMKQLGKKPDGNCAYCGRAPHGAATCFALNPKLRPMGWKPSKGIWAINEAKKPQAATIHTGISSDSESEVSLSSSYAAIRTYPALASIVCVDPYVLVLALD